MISPYPVTPPQGNLLGSIMDFIGQNRQLQLDAGTRNMINGQMGYAGNVDPFSVQKFQGEGQRQHIAGDTNNRANEEQGWQRSDRAAIGGLAGNLQGLPLVSQDPLLSALAAAGSNPAVAQSLLGMLAGDRGNNQQQANWQTQFGQQNVQTAARDAAQHQYRLGEIEAQNQNSRGGAMEQQRAARAAAVKQYAETGDRSTLLQNGWWDEQAEQARKDYTFNQGQAKKDQERSQVMGSMGQAGAQPGADQIQGLPPEQQQQASQVIVDRMMQQQQKTVEQLVNDAVHRTLYEGKGYPGWDAIRSVAPDLYNSRYAMVQEEMRKEQAAAALEAVTRQKFYNEGFQHPPF